MRPSRAPLAATGRRGSCGSPLGPSRRSAGEPGDAAALVGHGHRRPRSDAGPRPPGDRPGRGNPDRVAGGSAVSHPVGCSTWNAADHCRDRRRLPHCRVRRAGCGPVPAAGRRGVGSTGMTLTSLAVRDLRCIEQADLDVGPTLNLIRGGNGSGKTSLLESIFLLGRGRSFRTRNTEHLIRHGQERLRVIGYVRGYRGLCPPDRSRVRAHAALLRGWQGRPWPRWRSSRSVFAVQVIEPGIHRLVEEGAAPPAPLDGLGRVPRGTRFR